ncbi:MAG TPA: adenine deaminase [Spirochaetota bacterium]|nr:adenine deaminase [Spirochaetota bacterium]
MNRLYLSGGTIIDVERKALFQGDVLIEDGLISKVLDAGGALPADANILDVSGMFISPGFIESHMHIESSMVPPLEFSRAAVPRGTTCALVDPHEITNVFGEKAIEFFMDQADLVPMDMYIGIPSCVPATKLESSGAEITVSHIRRFMGDRRIYGLAEMMDFPDIIRGDESVRGKVDAVFDFGKIVDGHCPGLSGDALVSYVSNGKNDGVVRIMNDHEATGPAEAAEKLAAGMYLALRYGSADKTLDAILPDLVARGADLSRCMLCSDDVSAAELGRDGHVDRIIRRAREIFMQSGGMPAQDAAVRAIALATVNPAGYLSRFLDFHSLPPVGKVAPGHRANLALLRSLENIEVETVIRGGVIVAERGRLVQRKPRYDYSALLKSVNVGKKITPEDFVIAAPEKAKSVRARVIDVVPHCLLTKTAIVEMPAVNGEIKADPESDIAKIAVFERHHATGSRMVALARGLGIKSNAIASTVAHDSHNLIVAGVDDESMARAAMYLVENGGGMVVVLDSGDVYFPLQIGGLMSTADMGEVARQYGAVVEASRKIGMVHENIFMTLSFISLPVIPELKITDRGLVDVGKFDFVPLFSA